MAGPICKLYMVRPKAAWYELSEDERDAHLDRVGKALEQAGGRVIIRCASRWSSEQWTSFGLEEFPGIDAVQEHTALLHGLDHFRYFDSMTLLGTKAEQP